MHFSRYGILNLRSQKVPISNQAACPKFLWPSDFWNEQSMFLIWQIKEFGLDRFFQIFWILISIFQITIGFGKVPQNLQKIKRGLSSKTVLCSQPPHSTSSSRCSHLSSFFKKERGRKGKGKGRGKRTGWATISICPIPTLSELRNWSLPFLLCPDSI